MENQSSQQFYDELNKFINEMPNNFQIYVQMHTLEQMNIFQIEIENMTLLIDLFENHQKSLQFKLFLLQIRIFLQKKCKQQRVQQQNLNLNQFQIQQNILKVFSQLEFKNKLTQIQIQIRDFIKSIYENDDYEFLQMVNNFSILNEQISNQINEFEVFTQIYKLIDETIQEYLFSKLPRFLKQNLDQSFSSTSSKKRKRDESYKFDPNDLIDIQLPQRLNQSFQQNLNLSQIDQVMENDQSYESDNQIIISKSQSKQIILNQNIFEYKQIEKSQINDQNEQLQNDDDEDFQLAFKNLFENLNVLEDDKTQIKQEKEELKESIINQNQVPVYRKLYRKKDEDCLYLNYQDFNNFNKNIQEKQYPIKLFRSLFDNDLQNLFIKDKQIQIIFRVHPQLIYDYLKLTLEFQQINGLFEEVNVNQLKLDIENQKYFFHIHSSQYSDQEFKEKEQNHKQYLLEVANNPQQHKINQYFQCIKCKEIILIKIADDQNYEYDQYLIFAFPGTNHVERQLIEHYLKHVVIADQIYHGKHNLSQQIYQRDQVNTIINKKSKCQIKMIYLSFNDQIKSKFRKLNQNYHINNEYDIHFLSSEYFYSKVFEGNKNFILLSGNKEQRKYIIEYFNDDYVLLRTFGYYSNGKLVLADTKDKKAFYTQLYRDLVEHMKSNKIKL